MAPRTPRTARRELDPCMRARICELHTEAHWGYKRIHKVHPEIPISTIRNTIKKEQERINQRSKARSGTPAKLTDEDKQKLIELTIQNPHIKYEELRNAVDNKVTIRTIQNMFQQIHKRKWKQRKRPEILPLNAQKRLAWALRYEAYTPREWQRILWTDECTVERGKGGQLIWTWHSLTERLREHDIREIRTGKSIKKMFWGGFKFDQRSPLVPLTSDGSSAGGGITATVIRQLYMEQLPELLDNGDIFMQDNAPVHRAHIIRDLLRELGLDIMEWPPYSPDLNPIENIWAIMKTIIINDHPELQNAPDNDQTLYALIQAAKEAWQSIEIRVLKNLSNTMPNRVRAVIEADGWYTKY
ncbi:hypothetical protein EYB25_009867 [Talaromyces marneffei]|nr:hypothetical protein EYB25_009867 [Talaromyces marneffei]